MAVTDQVNTPRYPNFKAIMAAKKKPVQTWSVADLGLDTGDVGLAGSLTEVLDAVLRRCVPGHPGADPLTQFVPVDGDWLPDEQAVATADRPPLATQRATGS